MDYKKIGEQLKARRLAMGLNTSHLQIEHGIPSATYIAIEQGRFQQKYFESVVKYLNALDLEFSNTLPLTIKEKKNEKV